MKRQLADAILDLTSQTGFSVAASVLCIDESRMSDLRHGRIDRFSVERLIKLLAIVDRKVELKVITTGRDEVRWFKILYDRKRPSAPRP